MIFPLISHTERWAGALSANSSNGKEASVLLTPDTCPFAPTEGSQLSQARPCPPLKTWVKSTAWPMTPPLSASWALALCTQDHTHSLPLQAPGLWPGLCLLLTSCMNHLLSLNYLHSASPSRGHHPPLTWTTPAHRPGHLSRPSTQLPLPVLCLPLCSLEGQETKASSPWDRVDLKRWSQGPSLSTL